eukprot:s267_g42.t1
MSRRFRGGRSTSFCNLSTRSTILLFCRRPPATAGPWPGRPAATSHRPPLREPDGSHGLGWEILPWAPTLIVGDTGQPILAIFSSFSGFHRWLRSELLILLHELRATLPLVRTWPSQLFGSANCLLHSFLPFPSARLPLQVFAVAWQLILLLSFLTLTSSITLQPPPSHFVSVIIGASLLVLRLHALASSAEKHAIFARDVYHRALQL